MVNSYVSRAAWHHPFSCNRIPYEMEKSETARKKFFWHIVTKITFMWWFWEWTRPRVHRREPGPSTDRKDNLKPTNFFEALMTVRKLKQQQEARTKETR